MPWKQDKGSYELRVQQATRTVAHGDLTASAGTQTIDFAAALPANALVLTAYADVTVAFTDGAAGTAACDVGVKSGDADALLDGIDLSTAIAKLNGPKGVADSGMYGGVTLAVKVDGTVDVDTFTAGSVTIKVYYIIVTDVAYYD